MPSGVASGNSVPLVLTTTDSLTGSVGVSNAVTIAVQ
jgi:hypothetical protein